MILIANKIDLTAERVISQGDGLNLANKLGVSNSYLILIIATLEVI